MVGAYDVLLFDKDAASEDGYTDHFAGVSILLN